ncbi:hypothetical protein HGRIS_010953 [Hohenbuehelia grisea]|uniref:Peptidase S9 prolyl oligopeptidase catalytic domain-containing protein n=1 Tax=Hohenbuehelia grisea TaxID=104357 RepID=A0ABR3IYR2_9AGAR
MSSTSSLKTAPYGTWSSPITTDAIVEGADPVSDLIVDPLTQTLYHFETRPSEGGRGVLVETLAKKDVVGREWNVRTGVQEYGGGSAVVYGGIACFSNYTDARVYKVDTSARDSKPQAVTPDSNELHRFADFDVHPANPRFVAAVKEDHSNDPDGETPSKVITTLCIIDTQKGTTAPLVTGADFYNSPRFSPDGNRVAWVQWDFPDMPFDGSQLYVADVAVKDDVVSLNNTTYVAGEASKVPISYPVWFSNEELLFISDVSGYQNPWIYAAGKAHPVFSKPVDEEFGGPAWQMGVRPYAVVDQSGKRVVFNAFKDSRNILYLADLESGAEPVELESPYVAISTIAGLRQGNSTAQIAFSSPTIDQGSSIIICELAFSTSSTPVYTSLQPAERLRPSHFPTSIISKPQPITLRLDSPSHRALYVIYYPPTNPDYSGTSIAGEKPPCVINVHGGPTGVTKQGLDWRKQFFTSRGWGWLDVNYGGSTGFGRDYVDLLAGNWGVVDVEDCIAAVRLLAQDPYGLIDPARAVLRGGSAGGYTTLAALSIGSDLKAFAAGTSSFGLSDLVKFAQHTHKFESRYLDKLIGASVDKDEQLYRERSPLFYADNIVSPLLILQGDIDKVVPKEQAELIYDNIKKRGGVVEYTLYPGEGHGWRQKDHIKDALERELKFYEKQLNLQVL